MKQSATYSTITFSESWKCCQNFRDRRSVEGQEGFKSIMMGTGQTQEHVQCRAVKLEVPNLK
jgi:hypothetical protein